MNAGAKGRSRHCVALVTAPDLATARALAGAALEARLAACVNLLPGLESHYWWEGKLDSASEVLLVIKTSAAAADALRDLILSRHPYQTAEFITLPITGGSAKYLAWIEDSVRLR